MSSNRNASLTPLLRSRNHFFALHQLFALFRASFIEKIVFGGFDYFEEISGFEQARRAHIIRPIRVECRNVRKQFRVNHDLRAWIQLAKLSKQFLIAGPLQDHVGQ